MEKRSSEIQDTERPAAYATFVGPRLMTRVEAATVLQVSMEQVRRLVEQRALVYAGHTLSGVMLYREAQT